MTAITLSRPPAQSGSKAFRTAPELREAARFVSANQSAPRVTSLRIMNVFSYADVTDRLSELREIAADEGIDWNASSETDLAAFIQRGHVNVRPHVYLLETGCLRAVWKDESGRQVALHFKGNSTVQFVHFALREGDSISRAAGRDTMKGVLRQISTFDLWDLLRG